MLVEAFVFHEFEVRVGVADKYAESWLPVRRRPSLSLHNGCGGHGGEYATSGNSHQTKIQPQAGFGEFG